MVLNSHYGRFSSLSVLSSQHRLHFSCHKNISSSLYSLFLSMTMSLLLLFSILNYLLSNKSFISPFSILIFANHWKLTIKSTLLGNIELRIEIFSGGISILNSLKEIAILDSPFSTNHDCKFSISDAFLIMDNWELKCFLKNNELRMENRESRMEICDFRE